MNWFFFSLLAVTSYLASRLWLDSIQTDGQEGKIWEEKEKLLYRKRVRTRIQSTRKREILEDNRKRENQVKHTDHCLSLYSSVVVHRQESRDKHGTNVPSMSRWNKLQRNGRERLIIDEPFCSSHRHAHQSLQTAKSIRNYYTSFFPFNFQPMTRNKTLILASR